MNAYPQKQVLKASVLADQFCLKGTDKFSAADAFHRIENATKTIKFDLSAASFLSCFNETSAKYEVMYLTGDEVFYSKQGEPALRTFTCYLPRNSGSTYNSVFPIIIMGSCDLYKGCTLSFQDKGLFLISSSGIKAIRKLCGLKRTGGDFNKDIDLARKCARLKKSKVVCLIYREYHGIKKVVGGFARKDGDDYLKYDDLDSIIRNMETKFKLTQWRLEQNVRSVTYETPEGRQLTVRWSDSGMTALTATYGGQKIKCDTKELRKCLQELIEPENGSKGGKVA